MKDHGERAQQKHQQEEGRREKGAINHKYILVVLSHKHFLLLALCFQGMTKSHPFDPYFLQNSRKMDISMEWKKIQIVNFDFGTFKVIITGQVLE